MSYTYAQKKRTSAQTDARPGSGTGAGGTENAVPNSVRLSMLESGQINPTAADKGRRVDLPEAMRAKMESSFGMDFSTVKLYESEMLGQTGAEAMARGNEIAFAPGKLDFASQEGQARLGHELSHVASQARGEVHGNGFLLDGGLEERADREGAMAARGESVYADAYGGAVAPLSSASAAPMAGPMQAKGADKKAQNENKGKMEAALTAKSKANAMDAGSEDDFDSDAYYDNLDVWNGFIDQAASSDASDKSSAMGVLNDEWGKVSKKYEKAVAKKKTPDKKLAERYNMIKSMRDAANWKNLNKDIDKHEEKGPVTDPKRKYDFLDDEW